MNKAKSLILVSEAESKIHLIRGRRIMLDADLAKLYQVSTKAFNQSVKRNRERFPDDFAFVLTREEAEILRSQNVTSSWGGRRYQPYAFTEHGVAMLSAVLRSKRAIEMSIAIVRAFVRLREMIAAHKDLANRMEKLEKNQADHASILTMLIEEIKTMKALPEPSKRKIGFHPDRG